MPGRFAAWSGGFRRWTIVDGTAGAVHQDFGICELDSGGFIDAHIHSFEESFFVLSGEVVCHTHEGALLLREGDYGVVPVGAAHAWRNDGSEPARWAEMLAPQARLDNDGDTWPVDPLPDVPAIELDTRDPRNRLFGTVQPGNMEVARQTQDHLAASASMRTALLVYSGITVKMMVDSDLGAFLSTMFMLQYEPGGFAGAHDHPFEETFLIVEGETDAVFDGEQYRLTPGDVAWAGVGCIHEFANATDGPVRWLETQAPQPPARHSYRFDRDWAYLTQALEQRGQTTMADNGSVLVVGGTSEIGKRIAQQFADQGEKVIVTSRDSAKAQGAAEEIGGDSSGIALDLVKPHEIGDALGEVGPVKYLVLVAIERDSNTIDDFNVDGALNLFTMKLVGYTEVIHALRGRLSDDSSIVLFGGLAKERPYPGSTTVTTVNGGVATMIKSLAIQLAPIRVNAIHPAIVGDSPFWAATPPEVLDAFRARTPLGRLVEIDDVVHATTFLLENKAVNAINLNLDGGWLAM